MPVDFLNPGNKITAAAINEGIQANATLKTIKVGSGMIIKNFPGGIYLDVAAIPAVVGIIPVLLSQTGGYQSYVDMSTGLPVAASWTYTLSDLLGNVLALNVPLYPPRRIMTACTPAGGLGGSGGVGTAVLAPQLYLASPGQIPSYGTSSSSSGGSPTPYRLWSAEETFWEFVDCNLSTSSSSSSATSSSSSSSG
jgi:hypothetical protein